MVGGAWPGLGDRFSAGSYRLSWDGSSQGRQSNESGAKSNGFGGETHFEDMKRLNLKKEQRGEDGDGRGSEVDRCGNGR